ncbi:MAG TPA: hypothetical protein VFI24_10185 [Pyrinomonadaceae bacterium]|nr:hypothetical protein [Pyrinomonadaceae bacterium]
MNTGLSTAAEYHDSETDVFALFNACDGVIVNGLLDIRKLEEYSPEDAEALNVSRLKEVWKHTASGCSKCKEIVHALSSLRESVTAAI